MTLADDVDLEEFITAKDDLSGADIKAVCTEAGLLALRERRMRVTKVDFSSAREKVRHQRSQSPLYAYDSSRSYIGRMKAFQRAYTCNFLPFVFPLSGGLPIFPSLKEVERPRRFRNVTPGGTTAPI